MQKFLVVLLCFMIITSCKKDRYIFTMKSIKLNEYAKEQLSSQNLFLKIIDTDNATVLATTENYPSDLTLPAIFGIHPHLKLHLYKKDNIEIQLWGETSGLIASNIIKMKEYKIIFPIDMETKNDSVSFSVMGSWE